MTDTIIHELDDLWRVLIPEDLRNKAELKLGDRLTPLVFHTSKTIMLIKHSAGEFRIDSLGRIKLDKEHVEPLCWGQRDKLALTLDKKRGCVVLSMHKKAPA